MEIFLQVYSWLHYQRKDIIIIKKRITPLILNTSSSKISVQLYRCKLNLLIRMPSCVYFYC